MSSFDHVTTIRGGNIFDSSCATIAITTNSVGVMGAGLAKSAASKYPAILPCYREHCKHTPANTLHAPIIVPVEPERQLLLIPTKIDWRKPSEISYVNEALRHIYELQTDLTSLALPPLGCGLGGLDFQRDVRPLYIEWLPQIHVPIELYLPK